MELEVKILDINKDEFIQKIKSLGAILKKETKQFLYIYDLPTIYGRFIDIKTQLKDNESRIKYDTAMEKLKLLFFELDNLLTEDDKRMLDSLGEERDCRLLTERWENRIVFTTMVQFLNTFYGKGTRDM